MVWIEKAVYNAEYQIFVRLNDGSQGILDMKEILENDSRKIFRELLDLDQFRRFCVQGDTIVWENGLDLAPEFIRENIKTPVMN